MATLSGTLNNDRLTGTDEDDEISGLAGNDLIRGGGGNDRIFGGLGNDIIFGEDGDDELRGEDGDDGIVGGAGADRLVGGDGIDRMAGSGGDDKLFGQNDGDILRGDSGNDRIDGGAGDDVILGHGGIDTILGRDGNDRVAAGDGDDRVLGGNGNDRLMGQAGADILTGGGGADEFVYGSLSHAGDSITDWTPEDGDTLELIGALDGAEIDMVDDGVDTTVSVRPTGAQSFTDLVVLENFVEGDASPPAPPPDNPGPIDVWYGDVQTFGDPGVPQQWVNILGNVPTNGLSSLTWSLNQGSAQALATGPNNTRLPRPGDFNIEIDFADLDPTAANDLVSIRAAYSNGDVFTDNLLIDYQGGQQWPTDYSIHWSQVNDLQEVVQVVDGKWSFDDDGVRPEILGYDRILAIGDRTWDSYQVELSIHMNSLESVAPGRNAAIWLGMQWNGHTDDPRRGDPDGPHEGWVPGATFMFDPDEAVLRPSEFFLRDVDGDGINDNRAIGAEGFRLEDGRTYNFLVRNERVAGDDDLRDGLDRTYSVKVWEVGDPEPSTWLLSKTMIDQEPFGSFLLNAHHLDVTFGDISFEEIPPPALQMSDVLHGEDSLEPLAVAGSQGGAADAQADRAGSGDGSTVGPFLAFDPMVSPDDPALAA